MGLGGRKVKQRIPDDPRNARWAEDTSAPGYRLLSSMGWSSSAPSLGLASSQSLIAAGSPSSTPKKKVSVIPIAKDDNLGIGARKAGSAAGLGGLRAMIGSTGGMGGMGMTFVKSGAGFGTDDEEQGEKPKAGGGEYARLLERLNSASARNSSAEESDGDGRATIAIGNKRKAEDLDTPEITTETTTTTLTTITTTSLKNPRMAARSKHLRSKRLASASNSAAMAEILGIAPLDSSAPSSLPSSASASPAPQFHPQTIEPEPSTSAIASPRFVSAGAGAGGSGAGGIGSSMFPMFAKSSTVLESTFNEPAVAVPAQTIIAEIFNGQETEEARGKREKRERKLAKRERKVMKESKRLLRKSTEVDVVEVAQMPQVPEVPGAQVNAEELMVKKKEEEKRKKDKTDKKDKKNKKDKKRKTEQKDKKRKLHEAQDAEGVEEALVTMKEPIVIVESEGDKLREHVEQETKEEKRERKRQKKEEKAAKKTKTQAVA